MQKIITKSTNSLTKIGSEIEPQNRIFNRKNHFMLKYMQTVLKITGLNRFPRYKQQTRKILNCELSTFLYYAWNCIMLVQIICLISQILNFWMYRNLKVFLSISMVHLFNIIVRGVLIKNRKKFSNVLLQLQDLKYLRKTPPLKYQILAFTGCILIFLIMRNVLCLTHFSPEMFNYISDMYCFKIKWEYHPEILPSLIIILKISTQTIYPTAFSVIYGLSCYMLQTEFELLSIDIKECIDNSMGRIMFLTYAKALEIGNAIDSALSSSLFFMMVYMMVTIFYRGYEVLIEGETDEVSCFVISYL